MNRDEADDEEDNVAVEKISSWYLFVHVHDKVITVSCGDANQRVKWLAHVGIGKLVALPQLRQLLTNSLINTLLQRNGTTRTIRAGRGWASPLLCISTRRTVMKWT